MTTKITKDILESYLHCKYKGHLKLVGQKGEKTDYESLLTVLRDEVRLLFDSCEPVAQTRTGQDAV